MPINFTDFSRIQPQDSGLGDLLGKVVEGMKAQRLPGSMNRLQEKEELANAFAGLKNKYYPQQTEADIAYKNALTKKAGMFGGLGSLTGPAAQAFSLEVLKGINPEAYEIAKKIHDMNMQRDQTTVDYQKKLIDTGDKRAATNYGKKNIEQREAEEGFLPGTGGNETITPDERKEIIGQYKLHRLKEVTDPKTRERIGYATNLHKTINSIDKDALTMFSGPEGTVMLGIEKAKDLAGNPSPEYMAYKNAVLAGKLAAKQLRQFLQDSVQPGVQESLRDNFLTATWDKSPQTALAELNAGLSIMDNEIDTLYAMAESDEIYRKPQKSNLEKKAEDMGLNNAPQALTEDNIRKTAQAKGWDKKKTDWVLKKAGF